MEIGQFADLRGGLAKKGRECFFGGVRKETADVDILVTLGMLTEKWFNLSE